MNWKLFHVLFPGSNPIQPITQRPMLLQKNPKYPLMCLENNIKFMKLPAIWISISITKKLISGQQAMTTIQLTMTKSLSAVVLMQKNSYLDNKINICLHTFILRESAYTVFASSTAVVTRYPISWPRPILTTNHDLWGDNLALYMPSISTYAHDRHIYTFRLYLKLSTLTPLC